MKTRTRLAIVVAVLAVVGVFVVRSMVVQPPLSRLRKHVENGQAIYEGSWLLARGGPTIVGFRSEEPAELFIDGALVARGTGQQLKREPWHRRADFEPGIVAVRLQAAGPVQLLWEPAGRRGPPEYVPASVLSPEEPSRARFSSWAGANPIDGLAAMCLLLIGAGLYVFLSWVRLSQAWRVHRRVIAAAAAIGIAALVIRLFDLNAAGTTWDEDTYWSAGRTYITNILDLNFSQDAWTSNLEHPPVTKYIAGIGAQFSAGYGPARTLSACMVSMACALLVAIGARLRTLRVGVLAGLIAGLSPHIIAHSKIVGHEAPTLLWWTLAVWLSLRAFDNRPTRRSIMARFVFVGIVFGLAVWSRFVSVLAAPVIGSILFLQSPRALRRRTLLGSITILPLVAFAVGFVLWPRLWSQPFTHLSESWDRLRVLHGAEPFLGTLGDSPPRYYFVVYLYATAPLAVLLAFVGGLFSGIRQWIKRRDPAVVIALLWLLAPMLVLLSPVRQDGVRYIVPSLMALARLAAFGLDAFAAVIKRRAAGPLLGGATAAYLLWVLVRIHPYYLDYYGEQCGGPLAVAEHRTFEIGWWGEGLADAITYLDRHALAGARVFRDFPCVEPNHLTWMRGDLWQTEARRIDQADWVLVYSPHTRTACRVPDGFVVAYEVQAQGAGLAWVCQKIAPNSLKDDGRRPCIVGD